MPPRNEKSSLSIVIPVFNEELKIRNDIIAAAHFLKISDMVGEIIIIDDGSEDDTIRIVRAVEPDLGVPLQIISYAPRRGKGYAVRIGILQSRSDFIMYADSGSTVPWENILTGLKLLKEGGADIAHASRLHPESLIRREKSPFRKLVAMIFRYLVRLFVDLPPELTDTQCGFKIYRGGVAQTLYSMCKLNGFLFDIEIIKLAERQNYSIVEFPIEWTSDPDSRLSLLNNWRNILSELFDLRNRFG